MCRFFVSQDGAGRMMARVPFGMQDLAERLVSADVGLGPLYTYIRVRRDGLRKKWLVFPIKEEAWSFVDDVRAIPKEALMADRRSLVQVLDRIAASGFEVRPLLREEFEYLQHYVGESNWCRGIPYVA